MLTGQSICLTQTRCNAGGTVDCHSMPRQVLFPAGTGAIVDIGAGQDYVLAVDADGTVFGWGQGMHFSNVSV